MFLKVNNELHKIDQWLISNKLSLNVKKAIYSFFHKQSKPDNIYLLLLKLKINNYEIKRVESITFLGVLLDENLTWKLHIKLHIKNIENKIVQAIVLLFEGKPFLNKQSFLSFMLFIGP